MAQSTVVISHAPQMNYRQDFVTLPKNYGSPAYFARPDVQAIYQVVQNNLRQLDERVGFTRQITGKKVLIKPNLVTVYAGMGLLEENYPETTDPRVIDALVAFLLPYTQDIWIVESSGRGVPTRGSFQVVGLDRLAKHYGIHLQALEEQPVDAYALPKAQIQKEVLIPQIFREVIEGRAFYISVPKMKTNLYTGVTLGFKNAMGTLPYNLRQRNHHYAIDQKLVDLLYLFRPDLVLIDGLVGGQGNCPAPVEPVDSRMIISGNNSVETDRLATRLMGFDPQRIELMRLADAAGFGDPQVEIIGEQRCVPFAPADPSLVNAAFRQQFPNVQVLSGHSLTHAPRPGSLGGEQMAQEMELACRGGCLATTRFAFDMFLHEGQRRDFSLAILIGKGVQVNGKRCYLDAFGQPVPLETILSWKVKKLAVGSCTRDLASRVDGFVDGCMPYPNSPHMALHRLTGTFCSVMTPKNRHLLPLLVATLQMCEARKAVLRRGARLDCERPFGPEVVEHRPLTPEEKNLNYVRLEPEPLTAAEIRRLCAAENRAVLATFLG